MSVFTPEMTRYERIVAARAYKAARVLASAEIGLRLNEKVDGTFDGSALEVARAASNRLVRGGRSKAFPETMAPGARGFSLIDALTDLGIAAGDTSEGGMHRETWLHAKRSFIRRHEAAGFAQDLPTIVRIMKEAAAAAVARA